MTQFVRFQVSRSVLFLGVSLALAAAQAQGFGSWDPRNSRPSKYQGVDQATKQACTLTVLEVSETPQGVRATVETSYSHLGESPEAFRVEGVPNRAGVLSGFGSNGKDQLVLFFEPTQIDFQNLRSFNLRWLHRGHFHTERCLNLKQIE